MDFVFIIHREKIDKLIIWNYLIGKLFISFNNSSFMFLTKELDSFNMRDSREYSDTKSSSKINQEIFMSRMN